MSDIFDQVITCAAANVKPSFLSALLICATSLAHAQTPLHKARPAPVIECPDDVDLADCGLQALSAEQYSVAMDAWRRAAERGDRYGALWLAELYESGRSGNADYVEAYKWYDIAAAIHGAEIEKLPPGATDSNRAEINYRDYLARHQLTAAQVADAQRLAREWLTQHPTSMAGN